MNGQILEQSENPVTHFTEIGRMTAVLHEHSRAWKAPRCFSRFDWDLEHMVGRAPRWGSWQDADLEKTPAQWGLIHSDLRPSNIMSSETSLTVIDFDDSGLSWYLYDFASSITFYEHRENAAAMAANWIAGYGEVVPLTLGNRETLRHYR